MTAKLSIAVNMIRVPMFKRIAKQTTYLGLKLLKTGVKMILPTALPR
jgi:hypothetical protein